MTHSFKTKYKDRAPKDTIDLLMDFFTSRGFKLTKTTFAINDFTYSCRIKLFWQNDLILASNGKGLTPEFSLASGLAELYERFCSLSTLQFNTLFYNKYLSYIPSQLYSTDLSDILNSKVFNTIFKKWVIGEPKNILAQYCQILTNNNVVAFPYKNILDNTDIKYFDQRILCSINHSTGLAAGNTFEEAFIQGFSELLERFVQQKFFSTFLDSYTLIDPLTIKNDNICKILDYLTATNISCKIIDFNNTLNLPVVAIIFLDKINHSTSFSIGSAPVLDIAIERCFTEHWQGTNLPEDSPIVQLPFKSIKTDYFNSIYFRHSINDLHTIDERIFNNFDYISYQTANQKWAKENSTINELIGTYYQLIKNQGWDVYVRDMSLSTQMYAIQIFCDNLILEDNLTPLTFHTWQNIFKMVLDYKQYFQDFITKSSKELLLKNVNSFLQLMRPDSAEMILFSKLVYIHPLNFYFENQITDDRLCTKLIPIKQFIMENDDELQPYSIYNNILKKYILINNYYNKYKYTKDQTINFLSLLGYAVVDDDFEILDNEKLLYNEIFIKNTSTFYQSPKYEAFIKTFIKER